MEEAITAILHSQSALQKAVAELCQQTQRAESKRAPWDILMKLTPDDDIESFLEIFECTALLEKWPEGEWATIVAPFLTGEAQKACRNLSHADATRVKAAVLAHYGFSLPARAQRYHQWAHHPAQPARPQVAALARLTRSWLMEGEGPPLLERIVLDRCTRALPPKARRYVAQQGARDMEALIALLENHQVTQDMLRTTRVKTSRDREVRK